jgi:SET and MYND domain-containing protein
MAKTAWNGLVTGNNANAENFRSQALCFLASGHEILSIFGPEGDEDGPLKEMETLERLLKLR